MRNPLANEDAAFRFVLGTIAYFAPIVLAAWIATWLGVAVFIVATAVAIIVLRGGSSTRPAPGPDARAAVADTRRILVIAGEALDRARLRDAIVRMAEGLEPDVLIVCPIPAATVGTAVGVGAGSAPPALDIWLQETVAALRAVGIEARGETGDGDPLVALDAALAVFGADDLVVATSAAERSPWLEQGFLAAADARFDGPIIHVSLDASATSSATPGTLRP